MITGKKITASFTVLPGSNLGSCSRYPTEYPGAKIGIIGLNGSGKSTLLKIIAGIDKDYQGEVVFSPGSNLGSCSRYPTEYPGEK
ncbi:ATP-binding cassette domain-containing protein, partial [Parabacteroides distasonis]